MYDIRKFPTCLCNSSLLILVPHHHHPSSLHLALVNLHNQHRQNGAPPLYQLVHCLRHGDSMVLCLYPPCLWPFGRQILQKWQGIHWLRRLATLGGMVLPSTKNDFHLSRLSPPVSCRRDVQKRCCVLPTRGLFWNWLFCYFSRRAYIESRYCRLLGSNKHREMVGSARLPGHQRANMI